MTESKRINGHDSDPDFNATNILDTSHDISSERHAKMAPAKPPSGITVSGANLALYVGSLVFVAGITFGGMRWQQGNSVNDHDDFLKFKQEVETKMSYDTKFDKLMEMMQKSISLQEEQLKLTAYNSGAIDSRKRR
jgi:hypothetical protein